MFSLLRARDQSLVTQLRTHKLCGVVRKKEKEKGVTWITLFTHYLFPFSVISELLIAEAG